MTQVSLFFGRDIKGRAPLTEGEWAEFVQRSVAPQFPDGFTVIDARGQWLSSRTHQVAREDTKLVQVLTPDGVDLQPRVQAVADAYKMRFNQESVGVVTAPACAAF